MRQMSWLLALAACEASTPTRGGEVPRPVSLVPETAALPAASGPEGRIANLVNAYRAAAGLPPVALDPSLNAGCQAHAEYLKVNRGKPQVYALAAHDEDLSLPGATPAGRECGKAANIHPSAPDLDGAVHGWMGSLYHRRPILDPQLQRVGVGYATLGFMYIVVVRFEDAPELVRRAVLFPPNGETNVPLDFESEVPNPIPPPAARAGFPITLQVPWIDSMTNVVGSLDDGATQVPAYLSSPERPALAGMPSYGVTALIPTEPLRPSTRYRAVISGVWNGAPQTWTTVFTTAPESMVDAENDDAVLSASGKHVLVRGLVRAVTKINDGVAFVTLERPQTSRVISVQLEVNPATLGPVQALFGKRVEAHGRLRLEGTFARVEAQSARVVP